ncbi:MAG: energy transducer TonB [Deltaproteobacteria bacterium]|nr:energy transducer TonB [Deltaproteobacteria bacterium]
MKMWIHVERLLVALVFAVLLHLLLIQLLFENLKSEVKGRDRVVEVEYINPLAENRFRDKAIIEEEKKNIKEKEKLKEEEREDEEVEETVKKEEGQVVYLGEIESNKVPEKYKFLSEHNSVVEKETKSKYADNKYKNPAPTPQVSEDVLKSQQREYSENKKPAPSLVVRTNENRDEKKESSNESKLALKVPEILKSEKSFLKESEQGMFKNKNYSEELRGKDREFQFGSPLEKGEVLQKRRIAELFPQDIYSGKYSGGPFNDWLKDIEEADSTFLNAKEYKYATFFNRVKRSVSQYWNPAAVILKYDPYGDIYGNKDRLTIVRVKIDPSGSLKDVNVSQSSGVEFLDKIAIDAFKAAQPFPNPPKGLIDENGEITFNFGFYVEFSKSSISLFKYE